MYQIDAQNWSFVVLNSLAKVNKNKVITFERLKISLKSFMGIHNTRHQVQWCDCQVGHHNALFFSFYGAIFFVLSTRRSPIDEAFVVDEKVAQQRKTGVAKRTKRQKVTKPSCAKKNKVVKQSFIIAQ